MKTKTFGIILIVIGILMIVYTGINFKTTEKVVDIGPIDINKEKDHSIEWPPILGVIFTLGGLVIVARSSKSAAK